MDRGKEEADGTDEEHAERERWRCRGQEAFEKRQEAANKHGGILHVFRSVTTNPRRVLLVPLSVSKQILNHCRYRRNWRQICCGSYF